MILVTGATGFVGRHLLTCLAKYSAEDPGKYSIRAATRKSATELPHFAEQCVVGEFGGNTDWSAALRDVNTVIHLAARVHVMKPGRDDKQLFHEVNVAATGRLGEAAASSGVRRFVFLSSIKVNGEDTHNMPFTSLDVPAPLDAYGHSKLEAERKLIGIAKNSNMEIVIIRPPLVYGPGVRANFLRLLSWVHRGVPLPFGAISNRRSMVSVWNLCDLIRTVVGARSVSSGVLMASDGADLSTPDLVRQLSHAMSKSPRLLPVPVSLLKLAGTLTGKSAELSRLCGSLTVDITETRRQLGWAPPVSVDEGLARTARWYLSEVNSRGR